MPGILVGILADGTREQFADALRAIGIEVTTLGGGGGGARPPSDVLSQPGGLNGPITFGDVTATWAGGIPGEFVYNPNPVRRASMPSALWTAIRAYWPEEAQVPAAYIAFLESDFVQGAENPDKVGEDSWGVFQVNRRAWPAYSVAELTTYSGAARAGAAIYAVQGWGAWFNSSRVLGLL